MHLKKYLFCISDLIEERTTDPATIFEKIYPTLPFLTHKILLKRKLYFFPRALSKKQKLDENRANTSSHLENLITTLCQEVACGSNNEEHLDFLSAFCSYFPNCIHMLSHNIQLQIKPIDALTLLSNNRSPIPLYHFPEPEEMTLERLYVRFPSNRYLSSLGNLTANTPEEKQTLINKFYYALTSNGDKHKIKAFIINAFGYLHYDLDKTDDKGKRILKAILKNIKYLDYNHIEYFDGFEKLTLLFPYHPELAQQLIWQWIHLSKAEEGNLGYYAQRMFALALKAAIHLPDKGKSIFENLLLREKPIALPDIPIDATLDEAVVTHLVKIAGGDYHLDYEICFNLSLLSKSFLALPDQGKAFVNDLLNFTLEENNHGFNSYYRIKNLLHLFDRLANVILQFPENFEKIYSLFCQLIKQQHANKLIFIRSVAKLSPMLHQVEDKGELLLKHIKSKVSISFIGEDYINTAFTLFQEHGSIAKLAKFYVDKFNDAYPYLSYANLSFFSILAESFKDKPARLFSWICVLNQNIEAFKGTLIEGALRREVTSIYQMLEKQKTLQEHLPFHLSNMVYDYCYHKPR